MKDREALLEAGARRLIIAPRLGDVSQSPERPADRVLPGLADLNAFLKQPLGSLIVGLRQSALTQLIERRANGFDVLPLPAHGDQLLQELPGLRIGTQ